jgi:outer membrane protein
MLKFLLARVAVLALAAMPFAAAQLKVAVIRSQEALLSTAELKKAQADLSAKYKPKQDQIDRLQREIAEIQAKLNNQQELAKLSATGQADLQNTGARKQRELQRLQEDTEAQFNQDRQDVLTRAGQRMSDIVKKLAEEKAMDMVVDVSNTIYFKPTLDITNDAVAAYDKAYPAK